MDTEFPIPLPPNPNRLVSGKPGYTMKAVVTKAAGDFNQLDYRDVPVPKILPGTVLIRVLAAGVNNTEVNTRLGWYSASIKDGTDAPGRFGHDSKPDDGGWSNPTPFPFIQGTDCFGEVVESAAAPGPRPGTPVLVRPCIRTSGFSCSDTVWMGSDFDGAFAEYLLAPAADVFPVETHLSPAELGGIPCTYGTSENMLEMADVAEGETVLVKGASGGVGSATVQLALRRAAKVIAVTSKDKMEEVLALGAHQVIDRENNMENILGNDAVDVVVDNVGGEGFQKNAAILRRGGRIVSSGAIAGPLVNLDLREIYLKDLRIIGTTAWGKQVFPNLIRYIQQNEITPQLCKTFPLERIVDAQKMLLRREHVGKIVLLP